MTKLNSQKLQDIHQKILAFNVPRGWKPSPQSLAKSVVIEAAELLEHFQWDNDDTPTKTKDVKEIGFEIADVFWYLFELADMMNIDIVESLVSKYQHNDTKYPTKAFNGKENPDFYYAQKKKYRQSKKK